MRRNMSRLLRRAWHGLPIPIERKLRFKHRVFTSIPWAFSRFRAYRDWAATQGNPSSRLRRSGDVRPSHPPKPLGVRVHVPRLNADPPKAVPVTLVAFYLPQFHRIPENDAWWGVGFTEWSKVRPSLPLFKGHEQPLVPADLGYYDLTEPEIFRRQIDLAKLYGVGAYCFYLYWFGGKLLLERPLENYLEDPSLDLPFCLCWANENWSRRWDGLDQEILIEQDHSVTDDFAFIAHCARFMRDPRYLRVSGKPVLLVYRPSLLPSPLDTANRWRAWCRQQGLGEIFLVYPQSFDSAPPADFGFDAAVEFPPNNSGPPNISDQIEPLEGHVPPIVYDWTIFPERSRHYKATPYTLFRSVCPSWDNTARKGSRGAVFLGSSPAAYQEWLRNAVLDTCSRFRERDQRLVFVNAWNEWAEGAHLEPDVRHGHAYLQATRNALTGERHVPDSITRIIVVSHDAHPHGAQFLALNLARTLRQVFKCEVHLICLGAGPLKKDFAEAALLHDLDGKDPSGPEAQQLILKLYELGARAAIVNTTVSGSLITTLSIAGVRCIALIHELKGVLEQYSLQSQAKAIGEHARHIVCPAPAVAESFLVFSRAEPNRICLRPQGLYTRADRSVPRDIRRQQLREQLRLAEDCKIVLGVGYADERKGVDLFVQAALLSAQRSDRMHWVWIGHWEAAMQERVEALLTASESLRGHLHFPGFQHDTAPFYLGADAFALTSREDPFPSVVLEAFDAGLPVVGFEGGGGFADLATEGALRLVPHGDIHAFAREIDQLSMNGDLCASVVEQGHRLISERFSFRVYVRDLLALLDIRPARVSVIIPNFNYERYLGSRLRSVLNQSVALHEIIFLDDCSSDASVDLARSVLSASQIDHRIICNDANSGSVFRQWQKGIELATGDFIWIAEADDESEPDFLLAALRGFTGPGVVMSYCESQMIDSAGNRLAADYSDYVSGVDSRHWMNHFTQEGPQEVSRYMSVMNTIPNVSAVVFRRQPLQAAMRTSFEEICSFHVAGDWRLYVELLESGAVSFNPLALNRHRRHDRGVTLGERMDRLISEIGRMQDFIAARFDVPEPMRERALAYRASLADAIHPKEDQSP